MTETEKPDLELDNLESEDFMESYEENELTEEATLATISAVAGLGILGLAAKPGMTTQLVSAAGINQTMVFTILGVVFFVSVVLFFRKTLPWFRKR